MHLVGYTKNGIPVYIDLITSGAAQQISRQPHLLTLAAEALGRKKLDGKSVSFEHNMGRVVGHDFVVKTTDADTIFYAQLVKDPTYTRFIKNGKPSEAEHITIVLQANKEKTHYHLENIWIGQFRPPRPGSAEETDESSTYWQNHALVFDNQYIRANTLTKVSPF